MTANPAQAYQDYFGPAIFEPLARVLVPRAAPAPGARLLDVACGTGIATRRAASLAGERGHVLGIDINPAMVEVASAIPATGAPVEFRQGDALRLDVPDSAFDLVLCQQGLQFFTDRLAGAREMRRVLAGGGRAALAVWQGLERQPLFAAMAEAELPLLADAGLPVTIEDLAGPFCFGDADALHDVLVAAGFTDVEIDEHTIEARFAEADRFVERVEWAYAAVVPAFAADPAAFEAYVDAVARATKDVVAACRQGDEIVVPMTTNIAIARG